jgi:polar amino acid transport system permease protein
MIFSGFLYTIFISLVALIGSVILGFNLYLLTVSKIDTFRYIANIYNEAVFGTPLIVFIVVVYYMIWKYLPFDSRLWGGIVALVFYMGPYMKNLFEGAMKTIDPLQYQAMTVFGFTTYQKYRYIIIPQLIRVIIPSLIANLTIIIKGSSLLNFIGVPELYNQLLFVQYDNFLVMEGYLLMFITYLIITLPLIRITRYFEKRVESWN